tara:strand:- start:1240 stop:1581 length:342 start_codon:yes stop_codon:yes gene_type:complete
LIFSKEVALSFERLSSASFVILRKEEMLTFRFQQTLGVRDIVPVPVTFNADVYLDYSPAPDCRIQAVRAYARVPSEVLGMMTDHPGVPPLIAGLIGTDNPINDWFGTPPTPSE